MSLRPPVALFLFSNDLDRFLPHVERERKAIEEALEHFDVSNRLKVIARSAVSIEEIFRLFARYRGRILMLHFSGHANGQGLQFNRQVEDNEMGQSVGLAELFRLEVENGILKYVCLNGCSTEPQVRELQNAGVSSVIATRYPVLDARALDFAKQFYQRLANGQTDNPFHNPPTLGEAFQHARSFLMTGNEALEQSQEHRDLKSLVRLRSSADGMEWELHTTNSAWTLPQQVLIQGVSTTQLTIDIDGRREKINNRLSDVQELMKRVNAYQFLVAGKLMDVSELTPHNFRFIVNQARDDKSLPEEIVDELVEGSLGLIESLKFELQEQGVPVSDDPGEIIKSFGWLIEVYLQKMLTEPGQAGDLRAFSFMTEAFQASLRYLCLIQMAQILRLPDQGEPDSLEQPAKTEAQKTLLHSYLQLAGKPNGGQLPDEHFFDYLTFFIKLMEQGPSPFLPEFVPFTQQLLDTDSYLYSTALFLEKHRHRLLRDEIPPEELPELIPQYLTGLSSWFGQLCFLAKYRLLSVKDINLSYKLGFRESFIHSYGELHGMYDRMESEVKHIKVEEFFTYNQSVLLIRGRSFDAILQTIQNPDSILSLSPLVVDQSVFDRKPTQTPEIYFYTGQSIKKSGRKEQRYHFALYKNELPLQGRNELPSNKQLRVAERNLNQPKLNELYKQLTTVFTPLYPTTL